jgi:hypothetical protein
MMRQYTGIDILLKSPLGHQAIKNKMTPRLGDLILPMAEELEVAANEDLQDVTSRLSNHSPALRARFDLFT